MTIKNRTLLWLFIPHILLVTIAVTFYYFHTKEMLMRNIFNGLEIAADESREHVHLFLREKRLKTFDFGSDGMIREYTEKILEKESRKEYYITSLNNHLVTNKKALDPSILAVFVVDLSGTIISSSETALIDKDVSGEDFFSQTVKKGSYLSDLHKIQGVEHTIIEISSLLLSMKDSGPIGVIVNRYNGDNLRKVTRSGILEELEQDKLLDGLGDTGELYIVNKDKLMITGSRFIKNAIFNQVVDTEGVRSAFDNGEGMIGIYTGYRDVLILGVSKYIEEMDWVVLAEKDVSEAFAPIARLRNFTVTMGIISIIVIFVIAISLASGITRPINELVDGTKRISKGDLSHRINTKSSDEIGYLANSFNDMTSRLEESRKELQDYADNLEEKVVEKTQDIYEKTRQQKVIAEIGKMLWADLDINKIMDMVVIMVSDTLKTEFCKILLLDKSNNSLLLVSGVGWKDGLVGHAAVRTGLESQAGYTIKERNPIVVRDLRTEARFSGPSLLTEHGIVSGVSVPMMVGNRVLGVMGVHTATLRAFSKADADFLQSVGHFMAAFIERTRAGDKIKASLEEKEILLKEVHHRVKNNMQVVSSLLNVQSQHVKDKQLVDIFKGCQDRIKSMSMVHEDLYKSKDLSSIDFRRYARNLADRLIRSYAVGPGHILLDINVDNVFLGINAAIPCGLIINELFSNSLKYAFPDLVATNEQGHEKNVQGGEGKDKEEISLTFRLANNKYALTFKDNGIGIPESLDRKNTETLGLDLIHGLTQQLGGTIEFNGRNGVEYKIMFEA